MIYKFIIDKDKFKKKIKRHYSKYIIDDNVTLGRCYLLLATDLEVSIRTIYNFMNNRYSIQLLMKIIDILEIKETEEIFKIIGRSL